jgi:hypothetical protein
MYHFSVSQDGHRWVTQVLWIPDGAPIFHWAFNTQAEAQAALERCRKFYTAARPQAPCGAS